MLSQSGLSSDIQEAERRAMYELFVVKHRLAEGREVQRKDYAGAIVSSTEITVRARALISEPGVSV